MWIVPSPPQPKVNDSRLRRHGLRRGEAAPRQRRSQALLVGFVRSARLGRLLQPLGTEPAVPIEVVTAHAGAVAVEVDADFVPASASGAAALLGE